MKCLYTHRPQMFPADRLKAALAGLFMPGGGRMIVTTFISEEGAVSVTVDTDEAGDELPAFAVLALEQVARQSTTSAVATWLQLRNASDDNADTAA